MEFFDALDLVAIPREENKRDDCLVVAASRFQVQEQLIKLQQKMAVVELSIFT